MRPVLLRASGFTLLELIIVLFLALLMVGMGGVAMMGRLPAARLDTATREMSATIRQARTLAKVQMEKQIVVLDMDTRSFGIEGRTMRKIPEEVRVRVDDPLSGEMEKGTYRLVFSPSGMIEGGAVMISAGRRSISIKPDPVMGFLISRKKSE